MTAAESLKKLKKNGNKKIWLAVGTPFQVNFFHSLMRRLEGKFDFLITAREHDKIIPMLEAKGVDFIKVGHHGGRPIEGKLWAYAETIQQLIPIIKREKPDLLITERWPEAVRTAFGLNIPAWTLFYDEREFHANWLTFPLSSKIFAPSVYTPSDLRRQGVVDLNRVVWFNGFHACYLKDYSLGDGEVNGNPFADAGLEPPIVLVRPEPDFAVYFQEKQFILEEAVKRLRREVDARVAVIPRSREQAKRFSENSVLLNEAFYDVPVAYADVTVGAAETMLMESFVLGVPTVSAIYWEPSKPVAELHKYIPHFTSADEVVGQTVKFLDESEKESFRKKSERIVEKMENPIDKIVYEVKRLFEQDSTYEVARAHRRTQIEICIDILRSLFAKPSRFTHILQSANISHRELKKHIRLLMNRDFVEQYTDEFGGAYYKLTDKGLQIVQEYDRIRRELSL